MLRSAVGCRAIAVLARVVSQVWVDVMAEPSDSSATKPPADQRLDSWKAIAAYLGRDVTTVQRWERREGLPVHRHVHDKLGSVYAFREEVDAWLGHRRHSGADAAKSAVGIVGVPVDAGLHPQTTNPPPPPSPAVRHRAAPWLWIGGALVAGTAFAFWLAGPRVDDGRDPLDGAQYQALSDFEGSEQAAAISRDGQFVAFVSDRDGRPDVWVTRVGTSQFYNVTRGRVRELLNPDVRTLGFSPDGAQVTFWARGVQGAASDAIAVWAVPTMGGVPRPYLENVAEYAWDWAAERLAAHSPAPGDPTFIQRAPGDTARAPVFTAADGRHAHFPTWSPDGQWLHVVLGTLPDALDIFRMRADGTGLERLTHHQARVTHPVFLDPHTLLYLVSDGQQTGGALHMIDVETLAVRSLARGLERYHSLAASADGRRIAATLANTKRTLWRLPTREDGLPDASHPTPISLPTGSGWAPRHAGRALLYVTWKGAGHALWRLDADGAGEIWSDGAARIVGGPSVTRDGRKVAIVVEDQDGPRTIVMHADGTGPHVVGDGLVLRGEPEWTPDGEALIAGAVLGNTPQIVRLPMTGRPASIVAAHGLDPAWSPDGRMFVYSGADVGTRFALAAASPLGEPIDIPDLTLSRGARRVRFLGSGGALAVMQGDFRHKELWRFDLSSGAARALTALPADFLMRDYDVSADGRELVLERVQEHSDIVLIERTP
jgi:Tol biopolymer transport system component